MSAILNALFGHRKDKDDKKQQNKVETTTASSSSESQVVSHTAVSDDVHVRSVVSSESNASVSMQNSKKITDLMSKLGTTHSQVDEYSKKRTAEISEAVANSIEKVVAETALEQQKLLTDANERSAAIENEFKLRLQARVAELDTEKAVLLAQLERTLNERQEMILAKARDDIDAVQNAANQEKLAVLKQAQSKANQQVDQITEKVAELAAEDAQRRVQSTTQTVITTKAVAAGETHLADTATVSTTTTTVNKASEAHSSYQSSSLSDK